MSRPLRIEYPGAWYHVMNRGAGRQAIFAHDDHRALYLELLREIVEMFKVEVHAYCLMDNHYNLLIKAPHANLSRAMRHLNGVYTQRFNRSVKTDGSLFRGRYKAIIVDADAYLLSVSRYIHRNPVEADIVKKAERYAWSSYRAYIGLDIPPPWLTRSDTLSMIGQRNRERRYQDFIEAGLDQATADFYGKKKLATILGQPLFVRRLNGDIKPHREQPDSRTLQHDIAMGDILLAVAEVFETDAASILKTPRGRGQQNLARSAALYIARKVAGKPLAEIAADFGLAHYGSVSGAISRFEGMMDADAQLKKKVSLVIKTINK